MFGKQHCLLDLALILSPGPNGGYDRWGRFTRGAACVALAPSHRHDIANSPCIVIRHITSHHTEDSRWEP